MEFDCGSHSTFDRYRDRSDSSADVHGRDLLKKFPVVLRHLIDAVRDGSVLGNDFDPGELFLRNVGAGDHPAEILHEKLPLLGQNVVDEELARGGMGRGGG